MKRNGLFSMLFRVTGLGVLICGFVSHSEAQTAEQGLTARQAAKADVSPRGIVQDTQPSLTLESNKEGTFLTGKIGFAADVGNDKLLSIVSFRAPFDAKETAGFLNLDGLTGGTAATLKFSLEHAQIVKTPGPGGLLVPVGESINDICNAANDETATNFKLNNSLVGSIRSCTEEEVKQSPSLNVKFAQEKAAALWGMCQEVNKKRGFDLLAPPGEERANISGYGGGTCSEGELIEARKIEISEAVRKKAEVRFLKETSNPEGVKEDERQRIISRLEKEERDKACEGVAECTVEKLATIAVREEIATKNRAALVIACQGKLVVPGSALFLTGNTASNDCRLSSLLDFAFNSRRPAYWYRRVLRSFPVRLWYWTIEGTRADQSFKYFDPEANFAAKTIGSDSTRYEGSLSMFYQGWFYSVGVGQQEQFSAAPSQQVCFPRDGSPGALNCVQGALAGPDEKDFTFARGEIRTFLRPNVGATLRGIYDTKESEWELHTIFHFLRNPQAQLNGGIDFQYNTAAINKTTSNPEGDNFSVSLFVGTKFELPFLSNRQ